MRVFGEKELAMDIEVICGKCGKKYRVEEKYAGKFLKCKKCGEAIAIVAGGGGSAAVAGEGPVLEYGRAEGFVPGIAPATSVVTTLVLGWLVVGLWWTSEMREVRVPRPSEGVLFAVRLGGMVGAAAFSGLLILLGRHLRRGGLGAAVTVVSICGLGALSILVFLALTVPTAVEMRGWGPVIPLLGVSGVAFVIYSVPVAMGIRVLKGRRNQELGVAPASRVAGCGVFEEAFLLAVGMGAVVMRARMLVGQAIVRNAYARSAAPPMWGGMLTRFYGNFFQPYEQIWLMGMAVVSGLAAWGIWRAKERTEVVGLVRMGMWMGIVYAGVGLVLFWPILMWVMGMG